MMPDMDMLDMDTREIIFADEDDDIEDFPDKVYCVTCARKIDELAVFCPECYDVYCYDCYNDKFFNKEGICMRCQMDSFGSYEEKPYNQEKYGECPHCEADIMQGDEVGMCVDCGEMDICRYCMEYCNICDKGICYICNNNNTAGICKSCEDAGEPVEFCRVCREYWSEEDVDKCPRCDVEMCNGCFGTGDICVRCEGREMCRACDKKILFWSVDNYERCEKCGYFFCAYCKDMVNDGVCTVCEITEATYIDEKQSNIRPICDICEAVSSEDVMYNPTDDEQPKNTKVCLNCAIDYYGKSACGMCGEWVYHDSTIDCETCGRRMCEECNIGCPKCDAIICDECGDGVHCMEHSKPCKVCGKLWQELLPEDRLNCDVCGDMYCLDCETEYLHGGLCPVCEITEATEVEEE